jgi:hypothetical protein
MIAGAKLVSELQRVLPAKTQSDLAAILDVTQGRVSQIRDRKLDAGQIAKFFRKAIKSRRETYSQSYIKIIVELFPIERTPSKQGKRWELFLTDQYSNLRDIMGSTAGLYSFYDSRGKILYVGKTKNNLWDEMKTTYNRKNVNQPTWNVGHNPKKDPVGKERKISVKNLPLWNTARYFSCYCVDPLFVDSVEAMFTRMLPNDLMNYRIEGQNQLPYLEGSRE